MKRSLLTIGAFFCTFFCAVHGLNADNKTQFSYYDKLLVSDSIQWFQDANSTTIEDLKIDGTGLQDKILESNFHSSAGSSTYGTVLDFFTALSKIGKIDKIHMITAKLSKKTSPPYSLPKPLISGHCLMEVAYKPKGGKILAYRFKFFYYSDSAALKQLAQENKFPNPDAMDGNTYLLALEEMTTDRYPEHFADMPSASFKKILAAPIDGIKLEAYIKNK